MLPIGRHRRCTAAFAFVLAAIFLPARTYGSSVIPMTLDTMADHAGQVIVGEVVSVRSYWAVNPKRIESEVTFEKVDVLKAPLPGASSTLKLIVPGGKVGDMQMRICCAPSFAAGEKWVLFLLPTYKTFPVVGLYQGAFRVRADAAGVERVGDAFRQAVTGLDSRGFVTVAGRRTGSPYHPHLKASKGVRLKASARQVGQLEEATTYGEFLELLRPVLSKSKDHGLTESAGRRILVPNLAVPLRASTTEKARNNRRASGGAKPSGPVRRGTVVAADPKDDKRANGGNQVGGKK